MTLIFFRIIPFLCRLLLLLGCTSCSTLLLDRDTYVHDYQSGTPAYAADKLTKVIDKELPQENYLNSKESVWLLLDRATMRFAMGHIDGAIQDYRLALEAMDYYDQHSSLEMAGTALLQDDFEAYAGTDYEQVLARVYFALALIHKGDYSNAYAILRQGEELQQRKRDAYTKKPYTKDYQLIDNSIAKYLFAALLENRGDKSNAKILYQEAEKLVGCENAPSQATDHTATIVIVCHNGNAPRKISTVCNASVASAIALEIMLATQRLPPAWSSLTGIPIPALQQRWDSMSVPTFACIDGAEKYLSPWFNVALTAQQRLKQELPVIAARGVARMLLRRGAVAYANKQDACLGALIDAGMLIANINTQADTRSWTTLPNTIDLARFDLLPGQHSLTIKVSPHGCQPAFHKCCLQLRPHDFCVINVFNIHPGVTLVQVPQRFHKCS